MKHDTPWLFYCLLQLERQFIFTASFSSILFSIKFLFSISLVLLIDCMVLRIFFLVACFTFHINNKMLISPPPPFIQIIVIINACISALPFHIFISLSVSSCFSSMMIKLPYLILPLHRQKNDNVQTLCITGYDNNVERKDSSKTEGNCLK